MSAVLAPARTAMRLPRSVVAVQWLRRVHGWIGLWGATLGLLFGISGIWLNHRNTLKLPPMAMQRSSTQMALPVPPPADARALALWLQAALKLDAPASNIKVDAARPAPWLEEGKAAAAGADDKRLMQPERWTITFGGPRHGVQAEWWAGNGKLSVRSVDNGVLATLTNLHKGGGMPVPWILLVDTLAGSLILLSLSGVALWLLTRRKRTAGFAILGSAAALTALIAVPGL